MIFGAQGMLGSEIFAVFSQHASFITIPLAAFNYDISHGQNIVRAFEEIQPDIVINCAAFTDVDRAEHPDARDLVFAVNADAPQIMAVECAAKNITFLHISTDYVFDGERGSYSEIDVPNPINVYGVSKYLGEQNIFAVNPDAVVIRTARLFHRNGDNFVSIVAQQAKKDRPISAINDEFGNYTYVPDVAAAIFNLFNSQTTATGIYHFIGQEVASPLQISEEIVRLQDSQSEVIAITGSDLKRAAGRPKNSSLLSSRAPYLPGFHETIPQFLGIS